MKSALLSVHWIDPWTVGYSQLIDLWTVRYIQLVDPYKFPYNEFAEDDLLRTGVNYGNTIRIHKVTNPFFANISAPFYYSEVNIE
jgi:hypothetical protein